MNRGASTLLGVLLPGLVWASSPAGATPQTAADSGSVAQLIQQLSDADARVRRQATDRLAQLGPAARPEVVLAARSQDPEVRARAAEVLKKLPWDQPDDPRAARGLLSRYGGGNDDARKVIVHQMARLSDGDRVLLRLLREEPSDSVRWAIVYALATTRDTAQLKRIRETPGLADGDDPPALLLAGRAWVERDKPRGLSLLRRAIDADEARPTDDAGLLAFAYEQLIDAAVADGHWDEAASLLRRRMPRTEQRSASRRLAALMIPYDADAEDDDPTGRLVLPRLMALHELFGPLRGFEYDVRTWGQEDTEKPTLAREMVFFFARLGAAPPLVCQPIDLLGEERFSAAAYLLRNDFPVAARIEAAAALSADRKRRPELVQANVLFLRAQLAAKAEQFAAAADLLERGMRIKSESKFRFNADAQRDDDVWAQIHFFRARDALARGDAKAVDARVHDLLQLDPGNTDLALSIIDWLKHNDRAAAGKSMFEKLYVQAKARLDSADAEDSAGYRNDLAWLCARSGERVDEAVKLAKSAVAASPENPAFLDTLAEAEFRAGRADEAVKNESKALELSPDSTFMKQQLERFRKAGREASRHEGTKGGTRGQGSE